MQENDSRYRRWLEYAKTQVRSQSELSVNGHEIQRRIEGVGEKFAVSNYQVYSDSLRQWKDEITNHPLVANSDVADINWAVLQLLLDVACNPVDAMTDRVIRNNGQLVEFPVAVEEAAESTENALIESLLGTNQEIEDHQPISDELSDWSQSEDDEDDDGGTDKCSPQIMPPLQCPARPLNLPLGLKPPQRDLHYTELKSNESDSEAWLSRNTQNSWWYEQRTRAEVKSKYSSAAFAEGWNQYLDTLSMGFLVDKDLSTTSEYILMREIIWLLVARPATDCKFFRVEGDSVLLNRNVTTTSCSLPIIQSFLGSLTASMTHLLRVREFARSLKEERSTQRPLSIVFEIFEACLMEHIQALESYLLDVEMQLMGQNDAKTALTFVEELRQNHFGVIDALYRIHEDVVVLKWRDCSNYLRSAYMLSKLWQRLECPLDPTENNLTVSILIPCLQSFLSLFDSWWSLGHLYDYTDELVITEWGEDRQWPAEFTATITSCPLISFMVRHCRESHVVLAHISSMNRSSILGEVVVERPSYHEFLLDILRLFKVPPRHTEETQTESPVPTSEYYCELMELLQLEQRVQQDCRQEQKDLLTSKQLFELFQGSHTAFNLPFLDMILRSLATVVAPRIDATHKKVAAVFLDEYKIINHIRNVNRVFLLESPAMYEFYTDHLFVEMEADYNNLSPYQLTAKLDACLHAVHPRMECLFTVDVDRHYYKTELDTILDCLTKLRLEYNFQAGEGVIDFNTTPIYNRAFAFLLQIKWALWLLENLKYSDHLVRVKFFKEPNVLDFSIRRMGILRFWLLSSTKSVHSYLMHDVVETETGKLEKSLVSCTSIAKIQKCHERFLEIIEEKCFLGESQKELQAALQELLNFILIFRDYWHQLQDISDQDYRLEQNESKRILLDIKIDRLEETYQNIHQCLIDKLQLQTTTGSSDGEWHGSALYG